MKSASELSNGKIISIDGKRLRHSYDSKKRKSTIHMVSAFSVDNGVVLGQIKTDDKWNEITAIPELLKLLDISGSIVSQGADYVLAVKKNQKTLHEEISDYFLTALDHNFKNVAHEYYEDHYKGHGRIDSRRYWLPNDLSGISKRESWANLTTIGMAESERNINGKITIERRYFITFLERNAQDFGQAVRKHWAIENQLH